MTREPVDFFIIRISHDVIHGRLINWSRWANPRGARTSTLPMFHGYKPYLYPEVKGGGIPIDTLDAVAVQKLMAHIPEKHRWVIQWTYQYPFISVPKVCRRLAVSREGLAELLHDARSMLNNRGE